MNCSGYQFLSCASFTVDQNCRRKYSDTVQLAQRLRQLGVFPEIHFASNYSIHVFDALSTGQKHVSNLFYDARAKWVVAAVPEEICSRDQIGRASCRERV